MKINLLYGLLVCFSLFGCSDEDSPEPSYADVNWFVVNHDPNADELDQLRYEIFTETGVPIFYTDTLGSQVRTDRYGNSYTYYEVCDPRYIFTSNSTWKYSLTQDRDRLLEMMKLMDDYVLPLMIPETYPRGFLIVDTLLTSLKLSPIQIGMSMTVVSMHPVEKGVAVPEMTEDERREYGMQLAGVNVIDYLINACQDEMQRFLNVSEMALEPNMALKTSTKGVSCYGATGNGQWMDKLKVPNSTPVQYITKPAYEYGFFNFQKVTTNQYQTVSKHDDIIEFMSRILYKTDAEIREEIGAWPLVVDKYEIILEMLKQNGLEAWIKGE